MWQQLFSPAHLVGQKERCGNDDCRSMEMFINSIANAFMIIDGGTSPG